MKSSVHIPLKVIISVTAKKQNKSIPDRENKDRKKQKKRGMNVNTWYNDR